MDSNATRPITPPQTVIYRCACGENLTLDPTIGGICPKCDRNASPKLIEHDYSLTVVLGDDAHFELDQTAAGLFDAPPPNDANSQSEAVLPEVLIGKRFGHFEIIATLGRGGMGQVYRALDTSLQRYVAVKILRSGIDQSAPGSSDQEIDKLLQEAVAQARVSHPNIVTIYYVGKQDGNPFLAMELVSGETLSEKIAAGEMPFSEIASIAIEMSSALKVSYELDIIHGDIKPSNVLISRNGTTKLSDFGMARRASSNSASSIGGTPNYIAPEILNGENPSIQSDIYALGVTLFEMSFEELPLTLEGNDINQWIQRHDSNELIFPTPWPPRIPEKWKDVLGKMLEKAPKDRYQSYDELTTDLKRIQPGSNEIARFLPRLIAAGIDWILVLAITLGMQLAFALASVNLSAMINDATVSFLINVFCLLPILAYTSIVYFWRQSPGRNLMQLRVINRYGLRPSSKEMAIRSMFRMQFPWLAILSQLFGDTYIPGFQLALSILLTFSGILMVLDLGMMIISFNGTSMHDRYSRTSVVLDTKSMI